jgi:hypothetical protein
LYGRPYIICHEIFLNGTIFLCWEQTKHIVLNGTGIFLYRAQISEKDILNIN